jgi:hypothetical protein
MENVEKEKKPTVLSSFLDYIKGRLIYSVGDNKSFFVKLPELISIIEANIKVNIYGESILKNIFRKVSHVIDRDFTKNDKKNDEDKIRYCIAIITYEIYIKTYPNKIYNYNTNKMYELFPRFYEYNIEEQIKLFDFYKYVLILKDIISFQRNFGFIFDLTTNIIEGKDKKYARGGRANEQTVNRSKIVFDIYGEVKKPSLRHITSILRDLYNSDFHFELNDNSKDVSTSNDSDDDILSCYGNISDDNILGYDDNIFGYDDNTSSDYTNSDYTNSDYTSNIANVFRTNLYINN